MSITMETLRSVTSAPAGDVGRLRGQANGTLVEDTRQAGWFNFATKKEITASNRATAAAIKEALCRHYGRVRGEALFKKHIGDKGGDISTAKLRALLKEGDSAIAGKMNILSAAMRTRLLGLYKIPGNAPGWRSRSLRGRSPPGL